MCEHKNKDMNKAIKNQGFKSIFREYDIRGRVKEGEFDGKNLSCIAEGFAYFLKKRNVKEIVIGYDNRSCSPGFSQIAKEIFCRRGFVVYDLGLCITPAAYFAQHFLGVRGLMMITASHNPDGWCGCKIGDDFSKTLNNSELKELHSYCERKLCCPEEIGRIVPYDIRTPYVEDITKELKAPKNNLRIVVDAGNGAAGIYVWELFQKLGYLTFQLNCEPDDSYPHYYPNPSEKTAREALKRAVTTRGIEADLGLGFDGDGDRLGVVDSNGEDIWADRILMILSEYFLLRNSKGKVIFDVKCTLGLTETVSALGGIPVICRTGHSFIKEKMKEEKAVFAGERSGHIFVDRHGRFYDDALYGAALLLKIMAESGKSLAELLAEFPSYEVSPEIRIESRDEEKYFQERILQEYFVERYPEQNICLIDGVGVEIEQFHGRALIRASSNMPELVLVAEADSKANLKKILEYMRNVLKNNGILGKWSNM